VLLSIIAVFFQLFLAPKKPIFFGLLAGLLPTDSTSDSVISFFPLDLGFLRAAVRSEATSETYVVSYGNEKNDGEERSDELKVLFLKRDG